MAKQTLSPAAQLLNPKHRKAVELYISNGFKRIPAYVGAGFSEKTADPSAYQFFKRTEIQAYVRELTQPSVSGAAIVQRLVDIAFFNLADLIEVEAGNKLKFKAPLADLPDYMTACIETISETEPKGGGDRQITIKRESAIAALRILAKHFAVDINPREVINAVRGLGFEVIDQSPLAIAEDEDNG